MFDRVSQLTVKSAPVNCKADRLSAICTSRAKMSASRTRPNKTTLLVMTGGNGHFRTLRAITYKMILNKPNAILTACLHLLATFAFACKKNTIFKREGGRGAAPHFLKAPPLLLPVRRLCKLLVRFSFLSTFIFLTFNFLLVNMLTRMITISINKNIPK